MARAPSAPEGSMGVLGSLVYRPVAIPARPPGAAPRRGPRSRALRAAAHLLVGTALGALTVAAVVSLRQPQPAAVQGRTLLVQQIEERAAAADALATANQEVSADIARLQSDALATADPELFAALEEAELLSGAVPVAGPGIVVELDDPAVPDREALAPEALVQDVDVQTVANALWAAGAEAVAVNGQRLTAVSAIRGAGRAILVDLTPLLAPYRIEAVGDPRQLQTGYARSTAATKMTTLSSTYGIQVSVRSQDRIALPGGGTARLRFASVPDAVPSSAPAREDGTPSPAPAGEEGTT